MIPKVFTKLNDAVELLNDGWEIFTDRNSAAPYDPLYFRLWKGETSKRVHPSTISALIRRKIIHGPENQSNKYQLINPAPCTT